MSDYDKLKALFTEFGIGFNEGKDDEYLGCDDTDNKIVIAAGDSKVDGYCMFFTEFVFEKDGSFSNVGLWE